MTLAIETGVQNVTLAIFLTLTVLGSLPLAVTQNIYGVVMLINASLLIRWWRGRIAAEAKARHDPILVSAEEVARLLPYEECIPLMREAMIALSQGRTRQLLRAILDLPEGRAVRVDARRDARRRHVRRQAGQRLSRQFRQGRRRRTRASSSCSIRETGAPAAMLEAGEITAIRTAAASAAATDALARPRRAPARHPRLWRAGVAPRRGDPVRARDRARHGLGPRSGKAEAFAARVGGGAACATRRGRGRRRRHHLHGHRRRRADPAQPLGAPTAPMSTRSDRAAPARPRSTTRWSRAPASSPTIRRACSPRAPNSSTPRAAGLIGDDHLLGEIGEVMAGTLAGRRSDADVTIYKSLGSIVQDLAPRRGIIVGKLRGD